MIVSKPPLKPHLPYKKLDFSSNLPLNTNIKTTLYFNVHFFIDYLSFVCYISKVIIVITRICSEIWSERFYLVPSERTRLRVKVFGRPLFEQLMI